MTQDTEPTVRAPRSGATAGHELARLAVEGALEKKALDVAVMDLRGISGEVDYFVLATGESDLQIRAIVDSVVDRLRTDAGERPLHREGQPGSSGWIVLDYFDLVVHVFTPELRAALRPRAPLGRRAHQRRLGRAPGLAHPPGRGVTRAGRPAGPRRPRASRRARAARARRRTSATARARTAGGRTGARRSSSRPPADSAGFFVYPAIVDSVAVRAQTPETPGQPVPVEVLVKGALPDACSALDAVTQTPHGPLRDAWRSRCASRAAAICAPGRAPVPLLRAPGQPLRARLVHADAQRPRDALPDPRRAPVTDRTARRPLRRERPQRSRRRRRWRVRGARAARASSRRSGWRYGARRAAYGLLHALAGVFAAARPGTWARRAAALFLAGTVVFSGSLYALVLLGRADPRGRDAARRRRLHRRLARPGERGLGGAGRGMSRSPPGASCTSHMAAPAPATPRPPRRGS